ncbi:MAG: transposase [Kineosporiaceae bacterium]|nr:transposase [Kineosporiaceae bacterium]
MGVVAAMTLLAEIGDPTRFATEGAFARWCGIAPGDLLRRRRHPAPTSPPGPGRQPRRQQRPAHHAVTQARTQGAARATSPHRLDTRPGQTPRMARRAPQTPPRQRDHQAHVARRPTTTQPTPTTPTPQTATAA